MALISVHKEANFQYTLVSFRRYFESFKENYRFSMQLTLFYGAGFLLLYYSLFISTQMRGILYLMINFLLIALLLFFVVAYFNAMILYQNYDVKSLDLVKLSFILIFLVQKDFGYRFVIRSSYRRISYLPCVYLFLVQHSQ